MISAHRALPAVPLLLAVACGGGDEVPTRDGGTDASIEAPSPPPSEPGRHVVEVIDSRRIVPSTGLPPEVAVGVSNNNLDVVRHDGRVYLAWRSAADHLAGADTAIQVVSSDDEVTWRFEARFQLGTDLREPRLLSWGGTLFLYAAMLGSDPLAFEPRGVVRAEKPAGGAWTALQDLGWGPYIVWRTRIERGTPYLTRYLGGEHIYRGDGLPLDVELLTTTDGRSWRPVNPARPVVYRGGGSEADFAIADDGGLLGVIRNEAGDDAGFGSRICRAAANDLASWSCRTDPRKFDSPLMFAWDGEVYLVARRHVTESGAFDLMRADLSPRERYALYQVDYVSRPKRCAIWRYVAEQDRIAFVVDLPSRGDTCFPAWLPGPTPDTVAIYDYSSDPQGPDLAWFEGQRRPTFIYRHVVRFRAKP